MLAKLLSLWESGYVLWPADHKCDLSSPSTLPASTFSQVVGSV